jgi:hypothetical protein
LLGLNFTKQSAAMNIMTDIPLQFVKLCLGWKQAEWRPSRDRRYIIAQPINGRTFRQDDIRAIMKYVRHWCNKNNYHLELHYHPHNDGWGALCEGEDTWNDSMAKAAMEACIKVAMKNSVK